MHGETHGKCDDHDKADGVREERFLVVPKSGLVGIDGLMEQQRRDEDDQEQVGAESDLNAVSRKDGDNDAHGDLGERD